MNALFRGKGWSFGFRSAIMLYFVILIVLPIIGIYTQSFSLGWTPFWESVSDPLAWKSVLLTVKLSLIATIINMFLGTMIGWVLIRYRFPGRRLLNSLVDLPFALPTAVGGLMILLLLGPNSLVGGLAEKLGIEIVFHEPDYNRLRLLSRSVLINYFPRNDRSCRAVSSDLGTAHKKASVPCASLKCRAAWN